MAKIPETKFTQLAPPATSGQTLISPVPDQSGQVAANIDMLGRTTAAYALDTIKQEMVMEYSEKERKIDEAGWAARNSVTGDEEADRKVWEKFQFDAQSIAASSKYKDVNNQLTQKLNNVAPQWQQGIYTASLSKRRENVKDKFNLEYSKALENGHLDKANDLAGKALRLGAITQAEHDNYKANAPDMSKILIAERMVELGQYDLARQELEQLDNSTLDTDLLKKKNDVLGELGNLHRQKSEQMATEISNDIIKATDPNAKDKLTFNQVREKIIREGDSGLLTATQLRESYRFLESAVGGAGKSATENDPNALAQAYKTMASDENQNQKFEKIMSLSPNLKSTTRDGFIKDIYEPETVSNDIYRAYSSAITSLARNDMFSSDSPKNINLSLKAQNLLKMFAKENPNATEDEYAAFYNRLIETQTAWWGILPGGAPWWKNWGKEKHKRRYSLPQNIETLQKEMGQPSGLSNLSDEELIKRITGK